MRDVDPRLAAGAAAIGALAVDPNNPRVIYAGTGEANWSQDSRYGAGILWSINGGDTWTLVSGPAAGGTEFFRHAVSEIVIDPTVVTGAWSQYIYAAVVPAAQGGDLKDVPYRAVDGIYESADAGVTWRRIFNGDAHAPVIVTDIDFTVGADNKINLFAGVANPTPAAPGFDRYHNGAGKGIWRGTYVVNAATGQRDWTFTQLPQRPANPNGGPAAASVLRISLAADHRTGVTNPLVYAAVSQPDGSLEAVYKTSDNGATWSRYVPTTNPQGTIGWYALAIGIKPTNPNVVYLGGQGTNPYDRTTFDTRPKGLLQSVDGGQNWTAIDRKQTYRRAVGSNVIPHSDHHALLVVGSDLFDGNDGGIWRFTPRAGDQAGVPAGGANSWANLNNGAGADVRVGLQTNLVNSVTTNNRAPNDPEFRVWAGSHDNGLSKRTGLVGAVP